MSKPKILFICVANSCRSQMAEALARYHLGDRFDVYSAGSQPTQVNERAIQVLREKGLETSTLYSKSFDVVPREIAYAISLCSEQELSCPTFPATVKRLSWPMPDPANATGTSDEMLNVFREVRDAIEAKILEFQADLEENPPA